MDTEKLLNVLTDIIQENSVLNIQKEVNNLVAGISQNESKNTDSIVANIEDYFDNSLFNDYSISNTKILEFIKGDQFFGNKGLDVFYEILNKTAYNNNQTVANLQQYVKDRNEFMAMITPIQAGLNKLNFHPHYYEDNVYEIGLLIPEHISDNKISYLTKKLNKWDRLIKNAKELAGKSVVDTKISLINGGSYEFFHELSPEVALYFIIMLEKLALLYQKLKKLREASNQISELGGPESYKKDIDKFEKETTDKEIDKIARDLIKQFADKNIEKGRLNEIKIAINGDIKYIAKTVDDGLLIEINPPQMNEPEILKETETDENRINRDKELKSFENQSQKLNEIKSILKTTKGILGTGKDIFKAISGQNDEGDEGDEDIETDDKSE